MNLSSKSTQKHNEFEKEFDSQITNLIEEIELSLRWKRPSILLAIYESEITREHAQEILKNKIQTTGLKVSHINVDKENFDLGSFVSQFDDHKQVVFFITGLRWGGGKSRTNAYQALNIRREKFISQKIRLVIWLNPREAINLPKHAPDFWAFRHRVVEFIDKQTIKQNMKRTKSKPDDQNILEWRDWLINETPDDLNEKIKLRESMLADMKVDEPSLFMRIELMYTLAYFFWLKQQFDKTLSYLGQGLAAASTPSAISMKVKIQTAIGMIYHDQANLEKSIHAFNKAIEINEDDSHAWNNLGRALSDSNQCEEALIAFKRSTKLNPRNANAWNNLGNHHRRNNNPANAADSYKQAAKFDPQNEIPLINLASTHLALGQPDKAIRAYRKANRIDPSNVVILYKLGSIYKSMNRFKYAKRTFRQAIKSDPSYFPPYIGILACDNLSDNSRSKKRTISQAQTHYDQQNDYWKAAFQVQNGDNIEALKLINAALVNNLTTLEKIRQDGYFEPIYESLLSKSSG